jgi:hypothetical protein
MHTNKETFLYKLQGSNNLSYTDAGAQTLVASDLAQVLKGSAVDQDVQIEPIEIVAGGFDQYAAIPGKETGKGTLKFAMNPASSSGQVLPQWGKVLRGSCDFAVAETVGSSVPSNFYLSPINNSTDGGQLWHYGGSSSSPVLTILSKFYNVKGPWKISMPANKVPTLEITLTGAFHSESDVEPLAATSLAAAKVRENPYAFKGATVIIHGNTNYKLLSFDIEGGEVVSNRDDISENGGAGITDVTDKKIKFSFRCYAAIRTVLNPYDDILNLTEGPISIIFGVDSKAIAMGGAYAQFTERKKTEENGLAVFDIKGQMNRNDFYIKIN